MEEPKVRWYSTETLGAHRDLRLTCEAIAEALPEARFVESHFGWGVEVINGEKRLALSSVDENGLMSVRAYPDDVSEVVIYLR
jgi:hypothetical protein